MLRERVSNDIYIFTSDLYAQVTAGAVVTPAGTILIDTLPFPSEAHEMASFLSWLSNPGVRYVVLTHYHADHSYGAYLYPQADVVAHAQCVRLLVEVGRPALEEAKKYESELEEVTLRIPEITFKKGEMALQLGGKVLRLVYAPGHTADSLMVYVENDRVLFASDTIMPVPTIVDGDPDLLRLSIKKVLDFPIENLVQGHGEVILRGEVKRIAEAALAYLDAIEEKVAQAIQSGAGEEALRNDSIESCGLSRIPLNGLVQQVHVANLLALYERAMGESNEGERERQPGL